MSDVSRKAHWEGVYTTKGEREVSWFQENPAPSLELIALAGPSADAAIIDIGVARHASLIRLSSEKLDELRFWIFQPPLSMQPRSALAAGEVTSNGSLPMSPPGSHPKLTICGTTVLRFISSPTLPTVPPMSVV